MTPIKSYNHTIEKSLLWTKMVSEQLGVNDLDLSHAVLKATLKALRDTLPISETVQLGGELPTLIRGYYYENFSLRKEKRKIRRAQTFMDMVEEYLPEKYQYVDIVECVRIAMDVILSNISYGESSHIENALHSKVKSAYQFSTLSRSKLV